MNEDSKLTEKQKRTIGYRITEALALSDKKQKELAEYLNVTDNTISYFCKGSRTPNLAQIIKIAEYTHVSADYLLCLSEISSADPDDKAICEKIGCSEDALDSLCFLYGNNLPDENAAKPIQMAKYNLKEVLPFVMNTLLTELAKAAESKLKEPSRGRR